MAEIVILSYSSYSFILRFCLYAQYTVQIYLILAQLKRLPLGAGWVQDDLWKLFLFLAGDERLKRENLK